ncbi:MAG: nucleotidyltransferase domain-containing protein, partial [Jiangellaceae bacterium]
VLARTTRPMSGGEVHRLAGTGSANGVRLALARLVRQGVVNAEQRAAAVFYEANRSHLAWPAVEILAGLRRTMLERLREELQSWQVPPIHASLFGSAARGDGGTDADIDILLIRPGGVDDENPSWAEQIDRLHQHVEAWTGNHCQLFQVDLDRIAQDRSANDSIVDKWRRDSIALAGQDLTDVLRTLPDRRKR